MYSSKPQWYEGREDTVYDGIMETLSKNCSICWVQLVDHPLHPFDGIV